MENITLQNYIALFQYLAEANTSIAHSPTQKRFAVMDIDSILSAENSLVNGAAFMVLEYFDNTIYDKKSANILDEAKGAFMILQNVKQDDEADKHDKMDACYTIGKQILSRLLKERRNIPDFSDAVFNLTKALDLDGLQVQKVGPLFNNSYGFRFAITLTAPDNTVQWYDATNFNK